MTYLRSVPLDAGMTSLGIWSDLLPLYLTAVAAAGRAPGTIRLHSHYLARLARAHPDAWAVTTHDLRTALASREWAPETRKSARSTFRAFYRWGHAEGLIPVDPAERLEPVRIPAGVPRPTPELVISDALAGMVGTREELMIRLGAYAGLRCCEIARVHRGDYDHAGGVLTVVGKGGKTRLVPVVEPALSVMLAGVEGWAFPNRSTGLPLTAGHVSRLLSRALPAGWTAHTLRHRMATRALAETKDLLAVGQVLGHSRPETTQRYCQVADGRLRAVAAAAATMAASAA